MKRNRTLCAGSILYIGIALFCVIGSFCLPMDPYRQNTTLKNLAPSHAYLDVPHDLPVEDVVTIVSGLDFSASLLKDGTVVTWGETKTLPKQITDVTMLAAGDHHLLIQSKDGSCQLYHDETGMMLIPLPKDSTVKLLAASKDQSILVTETEHVYQINLSGSLKRLELPPHDAKISSLSLYEDALLLVLTDGTVLKMDETSKRWNGLGDLVDVQAVVMNRLGGLALHKNGTVSAWGEENKLALSDTVKGKQLAAGEETLFVLDEHGNLYCSGSDAFYLCDSSKQSYDELFVSVYQAYGIKDGKIDAWGNSGFMLGSDAYGRDCLTRLVHGGLLTMSIAWIAVIVQSILAVLLGVTSGYLGGWIDHLLMRFAEVLTAVPLLPLVITLSAFLRDALPQTGRIVLIMVLYGILSAPELARMLRSVILAEREKEYVLSARLLGASTWRILMKHLLPQITHLLLVNLVIAYADSMLLESSLSFLGFGVAPPYPTWGNLLEHAQSTFVLEKCWWQWLFPALCIFLCVWSVHLIGEGLRKHFDPKEVKL